MLNLKTLLVLALAGTLGLSACTDPDTYTENPKARTGEGAAVGAITGALAGLATAGKTSDSRNKGVVLGALAGAAGGAVLGSQLDAQARQLEQKFGNGGIRVVNTGDVLVVTMPQDILFGIDSATVAPALQGDLRILADSLNQYRKSNVQVIGHTDATGSEAYNQALSLDRARAVANVLAGAGVASGRLSAIGQGESRPVASNDTAQGRAQNRRVEIVIRPYT